MNTRSREWNEQQKYSQAIRDMRLRCVVWCKSSRMIGYHLYHQEKIRTNQNHACWSCDSTGNIYHLMTGPEGNSEFCFPSFGKHWDSSETKFTVPQGTSHLLYSKTKQSKIWKSRWDSSDQVQQRSNFAGNSELFPVWCHSFRNVARPQGVH